MILRNLVLKYLFSSNAVYTYINENLQQGYSLKYNYLNKESDMTIPINYENIRTLATMSYDAYYNINDTYWIDPITNKTRDIRHSDETVHAYLFSDSTGETNIISFKGTSLGIIGDISYNDKFNDNLFYSCCYYEESRMFDRNDCECTKEASICERQGQIEGLVSSKKCYNRCYRNMTRYSNNYYQIAKGIIENAMLLIGKKNIVLTGHSLGGTLASLMGLTYSFPAVTFNSPGEMRYAKASGLKYDPSHLNKIYHFGHNADTIFTGKCNGILSWCYIAGYIVETKCHLGHTCEYNATGELGISESILTHPMKYIMNNILPNWEKGMPKCISNTQNNCSDCEEWDYI